MRSERKMLRYWKRILVLLVISGVVWVAIPRLIGAGLVNTTTLDRMRNLKDRGQRIPLELSVLGDEESTLRRALYYDPHNLAAQRRLAPVYLRTGRIENALALDHGVVGRGCSLPREGLPDCWLLHASWLAKNGQADAAIRAWRRGADLASWRWPSQQYSTVETVGAWMYHALVSQQPHRIDWRLLLARLLWRLGRQDEAVAQAMFLVQAVSHSTIDTQIMSDAWLMLGLYQEASEDVSKAVNSFSMALKLNPQQVLAYPHLETLYYRMEEVNRAQAIHDSLLALQPERSLSDREVRPGWVLYGFNVDSWSIEEQPLLQLALFWRLPEGTVPAGDSWIRAGDHWIQVVEVFNLALNPGLEQDQWTGMGLPSGYIRPGGFDAGSGEELALVVHDGRLSKVLRQSAAAGMQVSTQLPLRILQVQEGDCFLFDAWTGGSSQSRRLGLFWRDSSRRVVSENYAMEVHPGSHPYVQCLPDGSSSLDAVFINNDGFALWDDIIVVPLRDLSRGVSKACSSHLE